MPVLLALVAVVIIWWVIKPCLKNLSPGRKRSLLLILVGGGLALLFLLKGKAVLSAAAALAAVAAKFAYSPLFKPVFTLFMAMMPGVAGSRARTRRKHDKQRKAEQEAEDAAALLGIPKDANASDIQHAYVVYMKIHHPDKGGSEDAAKQGAAARDVLLKRRDAQKNTSE